MCISLQIVMLPDSRSVEDDLNDAAKQVVVSGDAHLVFLTLPIE